MFPIVRNKWLPVLHLLVMGAGSLCAQQDTTNPSCAISSPSANDTVSGITVLTASASDDVAVSSVQFLVNFELHGVPDFAAPYDAVWNTFAEVQGPVFVSAIATDTSGNQTIADPVLVYVDNLSNTGASCSLRFSENVSGMDDHGVLQALPASFGSGEFTFEIWIKPQRLYPIGPTGTGGQAQQVNWSVENAEPYSAENWWERGNVLLDGRNFDAPKDGSFALQVYAGGRLRWLFGDGSADPVGGLWAVQAPMATEAESLLDGRWHRVAVVRRWAEGGGADLELWIDGALVGSESTPLRTDMTNWWASWLGFPTGEGNWIFGADKRAVSGTLPQHEDYKGLVDLMCFWNRAKEPAELEFGVRHEVAGIEEGLVAVYPYDECVGTIVADSLDNGGDIVLIDMPGGGWAGEEPLVTPAADLAPDIRGRVLPDGTFRLVLLGAPGQTHDLVYGTILGTWEPVTSLPFQRSVYEWIDLSAAGRNVGFYRLDRIVPTF